MGRGKGGVAWGERNFLDGLGDGVFCCSLELCGLRVRMMAVAAHQGDGTEMSAVKQTKPSHVQVHHHRSVPYTRDARLRNETENSKKHIGTAIQVRRVQHHSKPSTWVRCIFGYAGLLECWYESWRNHDLVHVWMYLELRGYFMGSYWGTTPVVSRR